MKTLNRLVYAGAAVALALSLHCNNNENNGNGGNGRDMTTPNPSGDMTGSTGGGDGGTGGGGDGGTTGNPDLPPGTPFLTSITPAIGPTTGGTALTLTGNNFPTDAQVYIDGKQATVTGTTTATQITVNSPAAPGKKGKVLVEVRRPSTGTVTSSSTLFSYYYGTLTFALPTTSTFAVGTGPNAIVLANVNANPALDAVVTNYIDNTVSVLGGNGDGTFSSVGTYMNAPAGVTTRPTGVAVADLNKDNILDVVTSNLNSSDVSILMNNGSGVLAYSATRAMLPMVGGFDAAPQGIAAGKFGLDTIPSVVTANNGTHDVSVLSGTGLSTLNAPVSSASDVVPTPQPISVALADMDKDGSLDIVVVNNSSSTVGILLAKAGGGFKPVANYMAGIGGAHGVAIGDFNGDGRPDVALSMDKDNPKPNMTVLLNSAVTPGTLMAATQYRVSEVVGDAPLGIATGDLNGDGLDDAVVTLYGSNGVAVMVAKQGGGFNTPYFNQTGKNPKAVAIGDLNGDGRPDLVMTNYGDSNVSVLLNNAQ